MIRTIVNQYNQRTLLPHNNIIKGAVYRHYKGNLYKVINLGRHSETEETMVIYKPLDDIKGDIWIRPASMWNEQVDHNGEVVRRFVLVE